MQESAGGWLILAEPRLWEIVLLSLQVSLSAVAVATLVGLPLGAAIAVMKFPGRRAVIVVLNALMGLPPVVVGLLRLPAAVARRAARRAGAAVHADGDGDRADDPDHCRSSPRSRARSSRTRGANTASSCARSARRGSRARR